MKLRTYCILAVVAFLLATVWLFERPDTMIGFLHVFMVLYIAIGLSIVGVIVYAIGRFFWALVRRLER